MTEPKAFSIRSADMPPDDNSALGLIVRMFQEMKTEHAEFRTEVREQFSRMSEQARKEAFDAGGIAARLKSVEDSGKNYVSQDEFKEVSARMRTVDGIVKGLVVAVGGYLIIQAFGIISWYKGGGK